jgi:hypothetical protein
LGLEAAWLAYPYGYYPYAWDPALYPYANPYPYTAAPPATGPAPSQAPSWYYCDSARSYYPYVDHCPEPWRAVPQTPQGQPR